MPSMHAVLKFCKLLSHACLYYHSILDSLTSSQTHLIANKTPLSIDFPINLCNGIKGHALQVPPHQNQQDKLSDTILHRNSGYMPQWMCVMTSIPAIDLILPIHKITVFTYHHYWQPYYFPVFQTYSVSYLHCVIFSFSTACLLYNTSKYRICARHIAIYNAIIQLLSPSKFQSLTSNNMIPL